MAIFAIITGMGMRRRGTTGGCSPINIGGTGRKDRHTSARPGHACRNRDKAGTGNLVKGGIGEDAALEYLLQAGYKLIERNWHCGHREIDLIMEGDDGIHIVEVKARTEPMMTIPERAVGRQKQINLESAAKAYVRSRGICSDIHFDIVSVIMDKARNVKHISFTRNAFYPIWKDIHITMI